MTPFSTHLGGGSSPIPASRASAGRTAGTDRLAVLLVLGLFLAGCGQSHHFGPSSLLFTSDRYGDPELYVRSPGTSSRDVFEDDRSAPLLASNDRREPAWSPDGSRLAFVAEEESGDAIYVSQSDETGRTRVADSLDDASDLVWSPDGSRIAFISDYDLYTIRPDGSGRTLVAESASDPAWAPDGAHIAFVAEGGEDEVVYTARRDGSDRRGITDEPAAEPAWSPDGSRIAYVSRPRADSGYVYTIDPDGTDRAKLVGSRAQALNPEWAPDGSRIAFVLNDVHDLYVEREIHAIRPDGAGRTRVAEIDTEDGSSEEGYEFAWSPDGARIAFVSFHNPENPMESSDGELYVVQLDGEDRERITDEGAESPTWAPDGSRIAFVSRRDGSDEVYVGPPDGTAFEQIGKGWARTDPALSRYSPLTFPYTPYRPTVAFASNRQGNEDIYTVVPWRGSPTQVTEHPAADTHPTWAPDRPRLAFASARDGESSIYTIGLDGSDPRPVTDHEAGDTDPDWGPGGLFGAPPRIVFVSDRDGNANLYTIAPDGSGLEQLTDHDATDTDPVWSPGGDRIAFASDREGSFNVYTIAPDGTGLRQITDHEAADTDPAWRASGDEIAFVTDQDGTAKIYETDAHGTGRWAITDRDASDPVWGLTSLNRFLWGIRESAVQ